MKRTKFIVIIALAALFCCVLTACASFKGYDDDKAIINGNSFSTVKSVVSNTPAKYTIKTDKCNGVEKIRNITVPENPVFDLTLTIEKGRFKVVLIKDDTVFVVCDSDMSEPVQINLAEGTYNLRIVAEDAKISFAFNFNSYT